MGWGGSPVPAGCPPPLFPRAAVPTRCRRVAALNFPSPGTGSTGRCWAPSITPPGCSPLCQFWVGGVPWVGEEKEDKWGVVGGSLLGVRVASCTPRCPTGTCPVWGPRPFGGWGGMSLEGRPCSQIPGVILVSTPITAICSSLPH